MHCKHPRGQAARAQRAGEAADEAAGAARVQGLLLLFLRWI